MAAELREITCEPASPDLRERIDELHEIVAAGEVSAVAYAVVYRDGSTNFAFSRLPSRATMIGAVARLQHKMLNGFDD